MAINVSNADETIVCVNDACETTHGKVAQTDVQHVPFYEVAAYVCFITMKNCVSNFGF